MKVRIDVSGERELMADLHALGMNGIEAAKDVLGTKSKEILALMRPLTPVKAGDLLSSERTSRPTYIKLTGVVSAGVVAGGASLLPTLAATGHRANVYAFVQEKGTELIKGKGEIVLQHTSGQSHFMEAAAMKVAPSVPDALREAIDQRANAR